MLGKFWKFIKLEKNVNKYNSSSKGPFKPFIIQVNYPLNLYDAQTHCITYICYTLNLETLGTFYKNAEAFKTITTK